MSQILPISVFTLLLCSEVFATLPQTPKPIIEDLSSISREGRLDEIVPVIDDIFFKMSPTTLEVSISAWTYAQCYDKTETIVELRGHYTNIIPRRSRSKPSQPCHLALSRINEKIAELDISDPSSRELRILGFRGWHIRKVDIPLAATTDPTTTPAQ